MITKTNEICGSASYSMLMAHCDWCPRTATMQEVDDPTLEHGWIDLFARAHNWVFLMIDEKAGDVRHFCSRKCRADYTERNVGSA